MRTTIGMLILMSLLIICLKMSCANYQQQKQNSCISVCDNMRELNCSAADGSKNGSCEQLCERFSEDPMISLNLECLSTIESCEEQVLCGN